MVLRLGEKWQRVVVDWLITWLFCFSLLWTALGALQYEFPLGTAALWLAGLGFLWIAVLRRPRVALATGVLALGIGLWVELPLLRNPEGWRGLWLEIDGFVQWVTDSARYVVPTPPAVYLRTALLLFCLGAVLLIGTAVRLRAHPAAFLLVGGGVFFFQEQLLAGMNPWALALFLGTLALYALWTAFAVRRRWAQTAPPPFAFFREALPVVLLAGLLAVALPAPSQGLGQPVLDWATEQDWFWNSNLPDGPLPDFGVFSFGGVKQRTLSDDLGGPLRRNRTLMLYVVTDKPGYLKGHTYDTYSGRAWADTAVFSAHKELTPPIQGEAEGEPTLTLPPALLLPGLPRNAAANTFADSYLPLTEAVYQADLRRDRDTGLPAPLNKLFVLLDLSDAEDAEWTMPPLLVRQSEAFVPRTQEIIFWNINAESLFLPERTIALDTDDEPRQSGWGDLRLPERQGKDFRYTATSYDIGLSRDELGALLRLSEAEGGSVGRTYVLAGDINGMLNYASARNGVVAGDARLLALPETLPGRVWDKAQELTQGQATRYDKALAIESWLRASFPYTLEVPSTPAGRDFVDYFLFDLQRGYCTYYATAMTVLCRAAGMPARYVEGFVPSRDKIGAYYYVTGDQAHAWCEVYFPGYGWLAFDPTASFEETFEDSFFGDPAQPTATPTPTPVPSIRPLPTPTPDPTPTPRPSATPGPGQTTPGQPNQGISLAWLAPLLPYLAGLLLVGLWLLFQRARRLGLRKSRPARAAGALFRRGLRLGRCLGVSRRAPETPMEWARRADEKLGLPPDSPDGFERLAALYGRALYGDTPPTQADAGALYDALEALEGHARGRLFPPWFWLCRHVLGWF